MSCFCDVVSACDFAITAFGFRPTRGIAARIGRSAFVRVLECAWIACSRTDVRPIVKKEETLSDAPQWSHAKFIAAGSTLADSIG